MNAFFAILLPIIHNCIIAQLEGVSITLKGNVKTGLIAVFWVLSSSISHAQISYQDIKNGHYGTPEVRAQQIDDMMQKGLNLRANQKDKVHEINLRHTKRTESEVIQKDLGNWAKYRKLLVLQKDKDEDLKKVLDHEQFKQYQTARDKIFWEGVKDYFF